MRANSNKIYIQLLDKFTGDLFSNELNAEYIEEMTKKTGNYKKFNLFVDMVASAIHRKNSTVGFDLLNPSDIETLKGTKRSSINTDLDRLKKYLVLNYAVAYDRYHYFQNGFRVHYPLPLILNEEENCQKENIFPGSPNFRKEPTIKETLRTLRKEYQQLEYEYQLTVDKLSENDKLRHQLKTNKPNPSSILKEKELIEKAFDDYKDYAEHEIGVLKNELRQLKVLRAKEKEYISIIKEKDNNIGRLIAELDDSKSHGKKRISAATNPRKRSSSLSSLKSTSSDRINQQILLPETRLRRPSPMARFDPTQYIREKERKVENLRR
ncbi:hypothetical protein O9G_001078 [Rozella allomycis CSF55]|uniref:Uncharacterized protein n=1 Tax=Rozella allomycis (strain CSF55) TaxID=988480 RepID=A0A075ARN0_ROZAC|nr:hypothetical protein O9G_001078 [Rozella allomycis CSF55]|eukprot:EPZ31167.1 hypothetical protein O9G_001078 [Rozella allomycis CSF55]